MAPGQPLSALLLDLMESVLRTRPRPRPQHSSVTLTLILLPQRREHLPAEGKLGVVISISAGLDMCLYTHTLTHAHTHRRTHTHAFTHTRVHTHTHAFTHT